jgi:hypothetical protein
VRAEAAGRDVLERPTELADSCSGARNQD